jgi:hypothetical protein
VLDQPTSNTVNRQHQNAFIHPDETLDADFRQPQQGDDHPLPASPGNITLPEPLEDIDLENTDGNQ